MDECSGKVSPGPNGSSSSSVSRAGNYSGSGSGCGSGSGDVGGSGSGSGSNYTGDAATTEDPATKAALATLTQLKADIQANTLKAKVAKKQINDFNSDFEAKNGRKVNFTIIAIIAYISALTVMYTQHSLHAKTVTLKPLYTLYTLYKADKQDRKVSAKEMYTRYHKTSRELKRKVEAYYTIL